MVAWAQSHSVSAAEFDAWNEELPVSDVVAMQASLYQVLPHADRMIRKLLAAARQKVIITEPIRNWANSTNRLVSFVGRRMTKPITPQDAYTAQRFDQQSLTHLFESFRALERMNLLPGDREMIGVFKGQFHG